MKLFTPTTSRWKWRIDASAPRAPRAARSYRLGVQCAQRAGSTSGARSTRDAENCPQERECSPARIHRPRLASGTKGRAVVRTCGGRRNLEATRLARPTRLPSRAKVHARRAVWAAWVLRELLSDSHVRAIAELGSNFDACMRAAHAGVKEKRSARLPGSLKRRVSSIMETSRNYSNAELRKVSVRDRGRECCATGWHEGRSENRRGTAKRDRRRQTPKGVALRNEGWVVTDADSRAVLE